MSRLRVALCQVNTVVGDLIGNAELILDAIDRAVSKGADLAVFPELAVSGYPPEDLLLEESFVSANTSTVQEIARKTTRCFAVVGCIQQRGGKLFNAAAVMNDGRIIETVEKRLLPNYGVFDERRYFEQGDLGSPLFDVGGVSVGVAICEDAWSPEGPIGVLAMKGAQLILSINASPYRMGVIEERIEICRARVAETSVPIAYVNLVGGQDELVFDGASMLIDACGKATVVGPQFIEAVTVIDIEVQAPSSTPAATEPVERVDPIVARDAEALPPRSIVRLSSIEEVYRALVLATADYVKKNGFSDVVIGLSGGIDSALVAVIATDALGSDHVHGVAMPSRFSSVGSLADAMLVASRLSIDFREIGIEPVHASLLQLLESSFSGREPDLAEENIQARVRGTILMALSNKFGWLVLTTGNKSELAVGYSTLYGDMAGGYAAIRDVPKTLVYELCAMRNSTESADLVPRSVIDKPPTAELRFDQRDDDTLPPYSELDPILEGYVERAMSVADLVREGYDEKMVRHVIDLVDHAEHKRRQAPPGVRVTSRGFGKDRRMPITNAFHASNLPVEPNRSWD